jgi:hypothetical protein
MGDAGKLEPLFLLSDEPIGSHTQNAFTDDAFARTVAEAAIGSTGPFTIGVYGGWGSGKTSALHAARTMIDADAGSSHVVTVEFNAWRYEREEHPIVPLVATIERAVAAKANALGMKDPSQHADQISWYKRAGMQCRALLAGAQFKLKPEVEVPFIGKVGAEATWTAKDSLQCYADLQKELTALEGEHWSALRDSCLSLSVFDALDAVGSSVGDAAGEKNTKWPLVVVFIDDLDRCQADKAFELLESVKLVLCQPGFVFVLALNHAVVDGYLTFRAEKLYGKDKASLHKSYLEKIVQLPLAMPSRSERFGAFATHLLDKRLSPKADPALREGLKTLAKLLALSANRTPRSLVRRINTALVDLALREEPQLPASLREGDDRRWRFVSLCIVQRTLESALGPEMTRTLAIDNALCELIAKGNIWGITDALKGGRESDSAQRTVDVRPRVPVVGDVLGERAVPVGEAPRPVVNERDERVKAGWLAVFDAIWKDPANNFLWNEDEDQSSAKISGSSVFTSPEGKRWLTQHAERRAIMQITVQRPDAEAPAAEKKRDQVEALAATATVVPNSPAPDTHGRTLPAKERGAIEKIIRQHLQLPANAPLGPAELARVIELDLNGGPITDAGAAWLADPATGLKSLTSLELRRTKVTDAGVQALARADTGLKALTSLDLGSTQVTDAGVQALARADTGLKALTSLDLGGTQVTDAGVKELARADTGLKSLTSLDLGGKNVTDAGVTDLVRAETGLKALTFLSLNSTQVTDAGVKELARARTGLRALIALFLGSTQVTDAGVKELARAGTGLQGLSTLYLGSTQVTDAGVRELARTDTGLKALASLFLNSTKVTYAGVRAVEARWPGIRVYN